jgi:hypothetical protein
MVYLFGSILCPSPNRKIDACAVKIFRTIGADMRNLPKPRMSSGSDNPQRRIASALLPAVGRDDPQVQLDEPQVHVDDPQVQLDDPQVQLDDLVRGSGSGKSLAKPSSERRAASGACADGRAEAPRIRRVRVVRYWYDIFVTVEEPPLAPPPAQAADSPAGDAAPDESGPQDWDFFPRPLPVEDGQPLARTLWFCVEVVREVEEWVSEDEGS